MCHGEFGSILLQLDVFFPFISFSPEAKHQNLVFPSESSEILFKPYIIDKTKNLYQEGVFSRAYQPAERAGSEEDMGGLMLYMASRAGAFLNGSVMLADGGKLATMPATY